MSSVSIVNSVYKENTIFSKEENGKRMIFYTGSTLNKDEMVFFEQFEAKKDGLGLPSWWQPGDTLRYAHTVKFNIENVKKVVLVN